MACVVGHWTQLTKRGKIPNITHSKNDAQLCILFLDKYFLLFGVGIFWGMKSVSVTVWFLHCFAVLGGRLLVYIGMVQLKPVTFTESRSVAVSYTHLRAHETEADL
eukprot:3710248-Amphidinium_carterae.1